LQKIGLRKIFQKHGLNQCLINIIKNEEHGTV